MNFNGNRASGAHNVLQAVRSEKVGLYDWRQRTTKEYECAEVTPKGSFVGWRGASFCR